MSIYFNGFKYLKIKKYIFLVFIVISSSLFSQTINPNGFNIFYHDNGNKSSEGNMRDGKPDGYWKNYYRNGKVKIEGNRKNYLLDSIWKFYSENGKITKSVSYLDGKKNGYTIIFDTNERVISKEFYIKDIKQGYCITYYVSGKTKFYGKNVNGLLNGEAYEYSEDSTIISIMKYQSGVLTSIERINRKDEKNKKQGIWKEFYNDGKLKEEKKYIDDIIDGYVKTYDKQGNLLTTSKFNKGKPVKNAPELAKLDVYKDFFDDGTLKYEGGYINGLPVGIHYKYRQKYICDSLPIARDDTSDVMIKKYICRNRPIPDSAIIFLDGIKTDYGAVDSIRNKIGIWTEYHSTGEFKAKGLYSSDKRIGEWIFYYPNGQIEQKGSYDKKGRIQGNWRWYYESGSLMREETYVNNLRNGQMKEYSEEGKIISQGEFVDDLQEGLWLYEIPEYKEIGKYSNNLKDSVWKQFYMPNEQIRYKGNFISGDEDGIHVWYYPNGKKMMEGKFIAGMKEKDWKFYDENEYNYLTITYENDIEIRFQGVKIEPTYEESLRDYSKVLNKKPNTTILLDNDK